MLEAFIKKEVNTIIYLLVCQELAQLESNNSLLQRNMTYMDGCKKLLRQAYEA